MKPINRRSFLQTSAALAAGTVLVPTSKTLLARSPDEPLFKISLAEWSINKPLFAGTIDHLDFPKIARANGIEAVEYVNQFFMDKAENEAYLKEMKTRADGEGVKSVLIMCDNEGALGDPDEGKRIQAVQNHYKWVDAAKYLGCHSIRVNAFVRGGWGSAPGDPAEEMKLVVDGLRRLTEYGASQAMNVIVENHGGNSSNSAWLVKVMKTVDHPRCGTLPDFGNFRIYEEEVYDPYQGVAEMMPFAKGVSVKTEVYTPNGAPKPIDLKRMMKIVLDAGYHGYCGIEHGPEGKELEGIRQVRDELLQVREALASEEG